MRLLRNTQFRHIALSLTLHLLLADSSIAQINIGALHVGPGTIWVSTPETAVVLDNMDFQYDAAPVLLNNIFRFTGQRINSIRGASQPAIYAISLAKVNPGMLTLNQSIKLTGRVNFESGQLDLNGATLSMQPDALLTNENDLSRLIGPFGGYVTIDAKLNGPVAANPGNLGSFIISATDLGTVHIVRGHQVQALSDTTQSIARWYYLTASAGVTDAGLRFNYLSPEAEGLSPDSLDIWQSSPGSPWTDIGYTTRNATQRWVEKQGLARLDSFTLYPGSGASITPPPLADNAVFLAGRWNNGLTDLSWNTISEFEIDHFDVQRKYADETAFTPIATLPTKAPGGTSYAMINYTYTDSIVTTTPDDVYYRIHELARNGESMYSNIIFFKAVNGSEFIIKCYPTIMSGGKVYIAVGNMSLQNMQYRIVDAIGRLIKAGTLPYQSQWLTIGPLAKGLYHLEIRSGDKKFNGTIIQ